MRRLPSLIALRFFEETARHMSFNRAAVALCVTQGAVSRQIKLLEESLGEKLFERLGSLADEMPDVELSVRTAPTSDCHCNIRFGRDALPDTHSELLMIERHVLVGAPSLLGQPLDILLEHMPALHVLHNDTRLELWPNWLAKAGMPARYADNGIEFSTLEQAIRAARKGAGLAIVDRNMIVEELADGSLAQFLDIEVTGPFGYWLDVAQKHAGLEYVQAFAAWMREEVLKTG
jgi:LysR family glycine cleavage system transcriptional activator